LHHEIQAKNNMPAQYFVGIGAQRTGTTWLANYFANHPQVGFSAVKELHYFDAVYRADLCGIYDKNHFTAELNELIAKMKVSGGTPEERLLRDCLVYRINMIRDPAQYKEYFQSILKPEHRVFGEITPSYSLLDKDGFQAILDLYPDAKFIFILRNPCDRYWSHLNLHDGRFEHFSAMVQAFTCLDSPQYFLRTDYRRTLAALYQVVPPENVLVLFFEHLFDPQTLERELSRITGFLNIVFMAPDSRPLNESKKNPLPAEYRKGIFERFEFVYQFIGQLFPDQLPGSWLDDMNSFK
jgi:hypothetical protein